MKLPGKHAIIVNTSILGRTVTVPVAEWNEFQGNEACMKNEKELFLDRIVVDRVFNTVMRRPFCTFVILCYVGPHHRTINI